MRGWSRLFLACVACLARQAVAQEFDPPRPNSETPSISAEASDPSSTVETLPSDSGLPSDDAPVLSQRRQHRAGGPDGMASGGPGGGPGAPGYEVSWYPAAQTNSGNSSMGIVRRHAAATVPLWRWDENAVLMSMGVREASFATEAVLPDTGRSFPAKLWNINLGLNYMHQFDNGWNGMLMTGFGSSSDKPFHSFDEMNFSLGSMLRIPARNARDMWMIGLMYSPAGALNFPIPMMSYQWLPSEEFEVSLGLPLGVTWRPTEQWLVRVNYIPLTNVTAAATYSVSDRLQFHAGYYFVNESYFLTDRVDRQDRFFGFEQRLAAGTRWNVWKLLSLDVTAGYAFNRYFAEGRNQGASLHDRVDVDPGAFLSADLQFGF